VRSQSLPKRRKCYGLFLEVACAPRNQINSRQRRVCAYEEVMTACRAEINREGHGRQLEYLSQRTLGKRGAEFFCYLFDCLLMHRISNCRRLPLELSFEKEAIRIAWLRPGSFG